MRSERNIVLIGGGGHSRVICDLLNYLDDFNIVGIVDPSLKIGQKINGLAVLGGDDVLGEVRKSCDFAHVAIGQIKSPDNRVNAYHLLKELGFSLPILSSPHSIISASSNLGEGTAVLHGAIIGPNCKIGNNVIINSKALIEHDSMVGNNCHISTGAILNGGVEVGDNSFIGSSVCVKEGIRIGNNCIIGIGACITKSIPDGSIIYRG